MPKFNDTANFSWKEWKNGKLPELADHSEKKLELLRDYLVLYLQIVLANAQGKEIQQLTLIDGFAGGGIYQNRKLGSPLVILKAVKEAEALINLGREKPVQIVPVCYFIEQNKDAFACLEYNLREAGFAACLGQTIHLRQKDFETCLPEILSDIRTRHNRGGNRTIFFLDQCGYTEVPVRVIQNIDQQLNGRAEFIINFSITWLSDFFSEATVKNFDKTLGSLGLAGHVNTAELLRQRQALGGNWRHAVESHIGLGYHNATGLKFFSPFYIEPHDNHRGYWLLHLAQNQRARAAMTQIHWSKANRSKHYGPRGYGILSYKPDFDQTVYIQGMSFDEASRKECQTLLANDYAKMVNEKFKNGIRYSELADYTSNDTIADGAMLDEVLWNLFSSNEIDVKSPSGLEKRSQSFAADDLITPKQQLIFTSLGDAVKPPPKKHK